MKRTLIISLGLALGSCSFAVDPPDQPHNLCQIFTQYPDWYDAALQTQLRWGTPIPDMMAIIFQESSFISDAQPPVDWFLGIIPLGRPSSALGYAQATEGTWRHYERSVGHSASRTEFKDAIDFIGWYMYRSQQKLGIAKTNTKHQYMAYHEGWGGYRQGLWKRDQPLQRIASKVERLSQIYQAQLKICKP